MTDLISRCFISEEVTTKYEIYYLYLIKSYYSWYNIGYAHYLARLELHGYQERISSLKAGLKTWLDHLNRLKRLAVEYGIKCEQLTKIIENTRNHVDSKFPVSEGKIAEDIVVCKVIFFFNIDYRDRV